MTVRLSSEGQKACLQGLIENDRSLLKLKYQRLANIGREYLAINAECEALEHHINGNVHRLRELEWVSQ
jgi:hypothetical protein